MGCGASKQPPSSEPTPPPIPDNLEPALVPFYTVSGGAGVLHREEIEGCLKALGMRKSVLALAVDPMDQMGKMGKKDDLVLTEWWGELNPRSKVVINAKLRTYEEKQTLFALACTINGTASLRKASASKQALRRALSELGQEPGPELDAMLAGCKEEGSNQLDQWYAALSPDSVATLRQLLNADA